MRASTRTFQAVLLADEQYFSHLRPTFDHQLSQSINIDTTS